MGDVAGGIRTQGQRSRRHDAAAQREAERAGLRGAAADPVGRKHQQVFAGGCQWYIGLTGVARVARTDGVTVRTNQAPQRIEWLLVEITLEVVVIASCAAKAVNGGLIAGHRALRRRGEAERLCRIAVADAKAERGRRVLRIAHHQGVLACGKKLMGTSEGVPAVGGAAAGADQPLQVVRQAGGALVGVEDQRTGLTERKAVFGQALAAGQTAADKIVEAQWRGGDIFLAERECIRARPGAVVLVPHVQQGVEAVGRYGEDAARRVVRLRRHDVAVSVDQLPAAVIIPA